MAILHCFQHEIIHTHQVHVRNKVNVPCLDFSISENVQVAKYRLKGQFGLRKTKCARFRRQVIVSKTQNDQKRLF